VPVEILTRRDSGRGMSMMVSLQGRVQVGDEIMAKCLV